MTYTSRSAGNMTGTAELGIRRHRRNCALLVGVSAFAYPALSPADVDTQPFDARFSLSGGAFVTTQVDEYHFYAAIIARHTGCRVIMPDYRLAPEEPIPSMDGYTNDDLNMSRAEILMPQAQLIRSRMGLEPLVPSNPARASRRS